MFHSRLRFLLSAIGFMAVGCLAGVTLVSVANSGRAPSLSEYIGAICAAALRSTPPTEATFLSANASAMKKMMVDMEIRPTGDVDRDFVAMMVPHHEAAIAIAVAVLRYGHNEQIRRLAQEIIVTQQQEIAAMRLAVDESLPASAPSPTSIRSIPLDLAGAR